MASWISKLLIPGSRSERNIYRYGIHNTEANYPAFPFLFSLSLSSFGVGGGGLPLLYSSEVGDEAKKLQQKNKSSLVIVLIHDLHYGNSTDKSKNYRTTPLLESFVKEQKIA
jgi:hypothetical protein